MPFLNELVSMERSESAGINMHGVGDERAYGEEKASGVERV